MPQAGRLPIGAADPDADHRLLLQHPLGTAACEEAHLNLAYRWFCGLGPDAEVSDHSTFSKSRHGRFRDSDLLPRLFETVLQRCIDEGLVGGRGFAVDASLIQAQRQRSYPRRGRRGPAAGRGPAVPSRNISPCSTMAFGAASEVTPKFIAPANPAARWTAAHRGPLLRRFDQRPDRCRQRGDHRYRGDDGDPPG